MTYARQLPIGASLSKQGFTLHDADKQNTFLIVSCASCRRPAVRYLASDLLAFRDALGYAAARGLAFNVTGAPAILLAEQALRRATEWIDAKYGARFAGTWAVDGQALAWPRLFASYRLAALPSDEVPSQIIAATVQAAVRELASPGSLTTDITTGKTKKRVKVEGIEVEYAVGSGGVASQTPIVSIIDGILAPLIGAPTSPYFGTAVRA